MFQRGSFTFFVLESFFTFSISFLPKKKKRGQRCFFSVFFLFSNSSDENYSYRNETPDLEPDQNCSGHFCVLFSGNLTLEPQLCWRATGNRENNKIYLSQSLHIRSRVRAIEHPCVVGILQKRTCVCMSICWIAECPPRLKYSHKSPPRRRRLATPSPFFLQKHEEMCKPSRRPFSVRTCVLQRTFSFCLSCVHTTRDLGWVPR